MDAVDYRLPDGPLVIFFYSPFRDKTMAGVLNNVRGALEAHRNELILVFYGANPTSIEMLEELEFESKELVIRADWAQFSKYRALLFRSPR